MKRSKKGMILFIIAFHLHKEFAQLTFGLDCVLI